MAESPPHLKLRTTAFALSIIRMCSNLLKNDAVTEILGKQVLLSAKCGRATHREVSRGRSRGEL